MIEWMAIPLIAGAAAFIPRKRNDSKIISSIFENRKIHIQKGENKYGPRLIKKEPFLIGDKLLSTSYHYTLPLGIPSEVLEALIPAIKEGLNKEVEYEFKDGLLLIDVFETKLPEKWKYNEKLLRPGTWKFPVGTNHKGILYHDFDKYQHLLAGGVTRYGKTVFLKEIFTTLLLNNPSDVEFYILDLKAGLEFYKYSGLPQVKDVACDVYEATQTLDKIVSDLKEQEKLFRSKGYTNIVDTPIKKRTFIIVDEGAELSPKLVSKEKQKYAFFCQAALGEIARIGGGLGYRLIFATQYPTKEAVPMQVKMNIVSRISFICAEQVGSRVLLDEVGAEDLPAIPGRAIYKVEKKRVLQVPFIDDNQMFKMMEDRRDELTNRKPTGDHRPPGNSEDKASDGDTRSKRLS